MSEDGGAHGAIIASLEKLVSNGPIGIAVSGGGDSMALLAIARSWAGSRIRAVTVDHGLRPESKTEAETVASFCAGRGIDHAILSAELAPGGNMAARARQARYDLLAGWARMAGVHQIALGHTLDDQAETVLLRLARGSGLDGLSAMAETRVKSGVRWLRPMLGISRADLRSWLTSQDVAWIEDPTNDDARYDRVRARQALLTLGPLGLDASALAETARRLSDQKKVLDAETTEIALRARTWGAFGEARIDPQIAASALSEIRRRLVIDTLIGVTGSDYGPRHRSLAPVLDTIFSPEFPGATLGGCLIARMRDQIVICREPAATEPLKPVSEAWSLWDRRWSISTTVQDAGVGALGSEGIASVKAAIHNGWQPPSAWLAAPHPVRLTLPAIWKFRGTEPPELVAVPPISYLHASEGKDIGQFQAVHALRHDASVAG